MKTSNIFLIICGALLMAHHLIFYGVLFDFGDWIGHDWLGLVMVAGGALMHLKDKNLESLL